MADEKTEGMETLKALQTQFSVQIDSLKLAVTSALGMTTEQAKVFERTYLATYDHQMRRQIDNWDTVDTKVGDILRKFLLEEIKK